MAKKNTAQEVRERIKQMQEQKAAELETIRQKQNEARTKHEAAQLAIKTATEAMNLEDFEKATADKNRAQAAIDMYSARYKQIEAQEYITEQESDKVISSLLDYEADLAQDFRAAIEKPINELKALFREYRDSVQETESTIINWTTNIHANYISTGSTRQLEDGTRTDRMEAPQPVHRTPYTGCKEANRLEEYLKAIGLK